MTKVLSGPNHWGHERDLYPQELEEALAALESAVAPVYRLLLRGFALSPEQRHLWAHWLLCQYVRTPARLLDVAEIPEQIVSHFKAMRLDHLLSPADESIASALRNIVDFSSNTELIPLLVLRDWIVYRAPQGSSFVKGDNPVIIEGPLVNEKARIVYPLGPEHCFEAGIVGGMFPPQQLQGEMLLTPSQVDAVNVLIAKHAEREIVCTLDAATPELLALAATHIGCSGPFFRLGSWSEWFQDSQTKD